MSLGWRTLLRRALLGLLAITIAVYMGDTIYAHVPSGRDRFDVVQVKNYLVVPLKGGKMQFDLVGTEDQQCVRALFPQLGRSPCWYVRLRAERWQEI